MTEARTLQVDINGRVVEFTTADPSAKDWEPCPTCRAKPEPSPTTEGEEVSDDLRDRLADALRYRPGSSAYDYADRVLPIVEQHARTFAAQQIRRIGDEHRGGSGEVWIEDLHRAAHNLDPRWEA